MIVGILGCRTVRYGAGRCGLPRTVEGMRAPLVVGFDLDLTLIDSRPGIAATYRELAARTGVFIDAEAAVRRLGPPLEMELGLWYPPERITQMAALFREIYPEHAVVGSPALPGAAEAFTAVRDRGGKIVVITGKYEPNARLHLNHLGLKAEAVVGWVWGETKTVAMREHGAIVYVGDHPADMAAARAVAAVADEAGDRGESDIAVAAVAVATGDHSATELLEAGADVVLTDLTEFPAWLDAFLESADLGWVGLDG
jgi:phosphoglycolate phosphatase